MTQTTGGRFTIDGKEYTLATNDGPNSLHGGPTGFHKRVFDAQQTDSSTLKLHYLCKDGEEGFPGNLDVNVTYRLTDDNELVIEYEATTDKATPVNLSNHAFYNLCGPKGTSILGHVMQIDANGITPVDRYLIPTGEIMDVDGTAFDFREPHTIGERIEDNHPQLAIGKGYDHNWVLNSKADGQMHKACTVTEPESGRVMEIYTDQRGLQFYSGNFFDGSYDGKVSGRAIAHRGAIALETQSWPDAINHPDFPDTVLSPGETYTQHSVYKFSVSR